MSVRIGCLEAEQSFSAGSHLPGCPKQYETIGKISKIFNLVSIGYL